MEVGNKTYLFKDSPYFGEEERIIGDFTSNNHTYNEISIGEYGDGEVWFIDRTNSNNSVLAYENGVVANGYNSITFANNVTLSASDYQILNWIFDENIPTRTLWITYQGVRQKGKINGKLKGTITVNGIAYPFDNTEPQELLPSNTLYPSETLYPRN